MKKKTLYFICTAIACVSLLGCSTSDKKEHNDVGTVIETEVINNNSETVTETEVINSNNETAAETEALNNNEIETEVAEEGIKTNAVVSPLPSYIDINNLDNCTLAVSLEQGDAYVDDTGAMQMDVTVYAYDLYDMVDIAALKEGDTIIIRGEEVTVTSLERIERGVLINGGLDENGYELRTDEATVWYEVGYSDIKSYYEVGKATIRISADMNFYDTSDLDKGEVVYYPGDFLTDNAGIMYHFVPHNTSIVIEDGMIIEMYRRYMP